MSERPTHLAVVASALPDTVLHWTDQATRAAPSLPSWLLVGVASALGNPEAGSDALLLVADSLEVMAVAAAVDARVELVRELRALAELPRTLAPERARPGEAMRAALVLARGMIAMDREVCRDSFTVATAPERPLEPDEAEALAKYDDVLATIDAALGTEAAHG